MIMQKSCPRAGQQRGHENPDTPSLQSTFPRCKLYRVPIIDALPGGCPLRTPNFLTALYALHERAFARFAARDTTGGQADLARFNVCMRCNARLHPHVRYLRAMKRGAA